MDNLFFSPFSLLILRPYLLFNTLSLNYHGNPLFNIAGAYFPAWLACMIVGIIGTWLIATLFSWIGLGGVMRPSIIMVPVLFGNITLWFWLIFFATR